MFINKYVINIIIKFLIYITTVTLHFNRDNRGIWTKGPPLIKIRSRGDPWVKNFFFSKMLNYNDIKPNKAFF